MTLPNFHDYNIAVLSTSRADINYLLMPYRALLAGGFATQFWASGQHFSHQHGHTIDELEQLVGMVHKIPFINDDSGDSMENGILRAEQAMDNFLHNQLPAHRWPKFVVVLGDRYELLGAVKSLYRHKIKIIHLAGGDITTGALDNQYRFEISAMTAIHCPTNQPAADILANLGYENIHNIGASNYDYILQTPIITRAELAEYLGIDPKKPYILCAYHSETTQPHLAEQQANILRNTLESLGETPIITTSANMDTGGAIINKIFARAGKNWHFFANFGPLYNINIMRQAKCMIGNSSSALYEAPLLKIPSINIGCRQMGRLAPPSVLHCQFEPNDILSAIKATETMPHSAFDNNPFGHGGSDKKLLHIIKEFIANNNNII